MKYLLDEHLSPVSARICRERYRLDVVSTEGLGRKRRTDEEQLVFAAAEGRVIVTQDRGDFADLTRRFFEEQRPHAGVLCVPNSLRPDDIAGVAAAIARYDREHPAGMAPYMVDWLRRGA